MGTWLKIVAWLVGIVGSIGLVLEIFFVEVWKVPSDDPLLAAAIEPTLSAGDVVVTLSCSVEEMGDMPFSVLRTSDHPEPPVSVLVEPSKWFLVSDDRHVHLDSRDFGQLDPMTCQHVIFRLVGTAGFGDARRRLTLIW